MLSTAAIVRKSFGAAVVLLSVVACVLLSRVSSAGLPRHLHDFRVEIAGVDYGVFDRVSGVELVSVAGGEQGYYKVTLERHFVAHPSLSFWALRQRARSAVVAEIAVVVHEDGAARRYQLRYCQPLSWSVETVNTASGGYHETVVLAVQEIIAP